MAVMLMAKAFSVQVGSAGKKLVLLKLADNANDKGECWPSYQHIADQCEISKRSAMNYINALIKDGLVEKSVRKGPKGNSTNIYLLKLWGEITAPHSANDSPPSENPAPHGEQVAPGDSEQAAPGISHSFESVSEPVSKETDGASSDAQPEQKQQAPSPKKPEKIDYSSWPELPEEQILKDWLKARSKARAVHSQTAINTIGKELHKAVAMGYTVNQCGEEAATRGWRGFKADWMQGSVTPANSAGVVHRLQSVPASREQRIHEQNVEIGRQWAARRRAQGE
jgi:hypothetical protein